MDVQLQFGLERRNAALPPKTFADANSRMAPRDCSRARAFLAAAMLVAAAATTGLAFAGEVTTEVSAAMTLAQAGATGSQERAAETTLQQLIGEALSNNPEITAAGHERDAAGHRISPAGALDDPMLEAGVINLPAQSLSFRNEDMTMKMIGLTQRLPNPGKRALRREVAEKEAEAVANNYQEISNRVVRNIKVAYADLGLVDESARLTEKNRRILAQFLEIAETRYAVGQGSQADVLKAQTQLLRMADELIKLGRERPMLEAELNRALGRASAPRLVVPSAPRARGVALRLDELREAALAYRPQLLAQQNLVSRSTKTIDLARKDYYPDFDVRFSYGQRDNNLNMRREDMISFTVAINLPIWRESKREPRVAEAEAMREQARGMYEAQASEVVTMLRQQVATAEQSLKSAHLYETGILPQARLAVEASRAAYNVNRVDFFTLLDNQMTVFNYEIAYAATLTSENKALAEIEFLTGRILF
jgi:cobalt-zinc-cadmium efflux system outer membrane protein